MKLLFNHDGNGTEEFSDALGFLYDDFDYSDIEREVKTATRSMIKLVGVEIYNQAHDFYIASLIEVPEVPDEEEIADLDEVVPDAIVDPDPIDPVGDPDSIVPDEPVVIPFDPTPEYLAELFELTRYAIALDAYANFAPNGDIAHTSNGRKMRTDGNEKQPFEWMLDRDNEQMERKFYKALDELIEYIELDPLWRGSSSFVKMHSSWANSTSVFKTFYPDGNRMLMLRLAPGLLKTQNNEVASRIPLIARLISTTLNNGLPVLPEHEPLLALCQEAIIYGGLVWGLKRLRVALYPEGILQKFRGDRSQGNARAIPIDLAIQATAQAFQGDLDTALLKIDAEYKRLTVPFSIPQPLFKERNTNDKFLSL